MKFARLWNGPSLYLTGDRAAPVCGRPEAERNAAQVSSQFAPTRAMRDEESGEGGRGGRGREQGRGGGRDLGAASQPFAKFHAAAAARGVAVSAEAQGNIARLAPSPSASASGGSALSEALLRPPGEPTSASNGDEGAAHGPIDRTTPNVDYEGWLVPPTGKSKAESPAPDANA